MKFFEQTRVLRLKTIYVVALFFMLAGATINNAIYIIASEFMRESAMLSFASLITGLSVLLALALYFLLTDLHNNHKNQDQDSGHV